MATVSVVMARNLVAFAGLLGADMEGVARAANLTLDALTDADLRVQHDDFVKLWDAIAERVGDDAFGLHFGEYSRRRRDNVIAYALQSCATVEQALRCGVRYARLVNDVMASELVIDGERAGVRIVARPGLSTHRHGVECALVMTWVFVQEAAAAREPAIAIAFTHARPSRTDEHARIFGAEPTFDAPANEVWFPSAYLARRMLPGDPELHAHLDRFLQRMLEAQAQPDDAFVQRVRRLLAESLHNRTPDIVEIANRLHVSRRHLQRRLHDAGTSFQALLDRTRHDLAMRYLEEPGVTLSEVCFLLGFSEPSTFHRAFKRWTGMTPAEARRQRRRPSL